jgi:transcriptional regulator with GAF, ATPase, and Fis domain
MTAAAVDALIAYDWPGNVRELERMIEGAIATADAHRIRVDDLPVSLRGEYAEALVPSSQLGDTMRAWGSRYVRLVLEKHKGQQAQGVPHARHQLPHAQRVSAIPPATGSRVDPARRGCGGGREGGVTLSRNAGRPPTAKPVRGEAGQ